MTIAISSNSIQYIINCGFILLMVYKYDVVNIIVSPERDIILLEFLSMCCKVYLFCS